MLLLSAWIVLSHLISSWVLLKICYLVCNDTLDVVFVALYVAIAQRGRIGKMFGNSRYFGLTGTRLNVVIGVLAGVDFWQVPGI